jgi:hypothetical protein
VTIDPAHIADAERARALYLNNLDPAEATADWHYAVRQTRKLVANALRASAYLGDIETALRHDCAHTLVFRQLLAPPMSQDQFKLVCPVWNKSYENAGRPLDAPAARATAAVISERLDRGVVKWAAGAVPNSRPAVVALLRVASTLMALQKVSTARRTRLAFEQEYAVTEMLEDTGWTRLPSKLIDTRAAVPPYHFMHKTRFATNTTRPQEVDIACGLRGSYVLAMECKVTNDETNSVKRINDVLKKATAWKDHWGSFVKTAALLQGVIAPKDVQRLADAGVSVFWSHDLGEFQKWLSGQMTQVNRASG